MTGPTFSVVITTYNRVAIVSRAIRSVLASDFDDYEIVVVDDGSTDDTVPTLESGFSDQRLRIVALAENGGMSPARRVGTESAKGEWVVMLDSDWEMKPETLRRMKATIDAGPDDVRVYCFRMLWDTGRIEPEAVPSGVADYEAKLRWWNGGKAGDCIRASRREVFDTTPYHSPQRGMIDSLYELELAKHERAIFSEEVLAIQHGDAANSFLRASDPAALIPRLQREAQDMLWMAETALAGHESALARYAPRILQELTLTAAVQSFILGQRLQGIRWSRKALTATPTDPNVYLMILAGLSGPWLTLRAIVFDRQRSARRRRRRGTAR